MKRLYLVRHGETLFNTQGKIQGWSDSPLTERGIKQAQAVRDYFGSEGIRFDHAYSSTSERASDTLELITGMPYARLKGLKEVNYGFFEGEREMLKPKEPQEIVSFFVPFGGENTNDVAERVAKTLTEVMEQEDHTNVLAVSHTRRRSWRKVSRTGASSFTDTKRRYSDWRKSSGRFYSAIRLYV